MRRHIHFSKYFSKYISSSALCNLRSNTAGLTSVLEILLRLYLTTYFNFKYNFSIMKFIFLILFHLFVMRDLSVIYFYFSCLVETRSGMRCWQTLLMSLLFPGLLQPRSFSELIYLNLSHYILYILFSHIYRASFSILLH